MEKVTGVRHRDSALYAALFVGAFVLNVVWEEWHSQFYLYYQSAAITHLILLQAAFFDAAFITAVVFLAKRVFDHRHGARIARAVAVVVALVFAIGLEMFALQTDRWAYADAMPLLPILGVGITPVIQLPLLTYLSIFLGTFVSNTTKPFRFTLLVLLGAVFLLGGIFFTDRDQSKISPDTHQAVSGADVLVAGLSIPWEVAFLPDGDMLVTERTGRLLLLSPNGSDGSGITTKILLSGVGTHRGEGGLLGVAVHPEFHDRGFIYLYVTDTDKNGKTTNSVWQYWLSNGELLTPAPILTDIPGAAYHDGGRLAFGPDGLLYITTGDAGDENNAQNRNSLAGKILRIDPRGEIPPDNPFGTAIYSYGHRNPQGLAWDEEGNLWATEHGRSGILSGYDEVNKIVRGGNYGWPVIQGDETREGMIAPEIHSGARETWAPSGAAYYNGYLIFAGLRGKSLYVVDFGSGNAWEVKAHFRGEYGRLRTVVLGPDRMFYVLTSNRDGRGKPIAADDRIIRIAPALLDL